MAKEDDEMKERITKEMDALGYVPASVDGFSDGLLRWKLKEGMEYELGFDGWELTEMFVNSVKELQEKYTLQELLERKNGDYSKIEFSDYMETEIDTAIYIQQRENERKIAGQLISYVSEIKEKEQSVVAKVAEGQYEKADEINKEISELRKRMNGIKEEIQSKKITVEDIEVLRDIEPKRKSVQNFLEDEVALLPKLEKLLKDELGKKSPFEMRNSNNEWRNNRNKAIDIIEVSEHELPKKITDIRRKDYMKKINRGLFTNKDLSIDVIFGRNAVSEIVDNALRDERRNRNVEARIAAIFNMNELIENSIYFDSAISEYNPIIAKNKSPNTMFMHELYGIFRHNGEVYLAHLEVEEMFTKDYEKIEGTQNRLYSFKSIKTAPLEPGFDPRDQLSDDNGNVPHGANITISQLYQIVKKHDKNFFENPMAVGRAEREAEIEQKKEYEKAVMEIEEKKQEKDEITHGEEVIEKNNSIDAGKSLDEQKSEALYKGITSVMDSTEFKNYCDTMNKLMYNNYSGKNCLKILSQWIQRYCDDKGIDLTKLSKKEMHEKISEALNSRDKPTYLMGYEAWKQYGRQVTGKGVAYEIVVPNMVKEKEGKGSLLKAIKKSFAEQFASTSSLEYAQYQLGRSKLGFYGYKNGLIDIVYDGKVIQGKQTEETVRRFLDTQVIGKVPNGYSTSFVYDVKNTVVPEHLWVKNGFRKDELALDENGDPVTRKPYKNSKITEYKIVNTEERKNKFKPNISQDIVQLDEGKMGVLFDVLKKVSEGKGVPMSAEPIADVGTKGFFSHKDNRIVIKDDLSATEKCAVAFHEMAHADMHYQRSDLSREMKEVQAEAVAYITAQNFGIETSTSSFNYIAVWSSGRDVKELESSMSDILNQSKKLFREISAELNERGLTINLEPVKQETFAKQKIEEFIKDNKQFVLDETRAANELRNTAMKQLEATTDERCSNIIKEQIVICNDMVRTLNAADQTLHKLEQAADAETAKKIMGNANKAYSQVLEMKEKFSGLSDELAERMQEIKESGRMTVLEKYMENPVESMKEYIRDADAKDLESGFKESLKSLTDKDLTYIARSQYLSGILHKTVKTVDSDLTAFMQKAVEQVKNVNQIKAKNGSFVEISLCEQWTKKPVFKEGTVAHPKTADKIFGAAEKEMREKKREAQKEGSYLPYTKCCLSVFTEHGNHLFATETRIDIGDGEQKNLSDHLKQCCRDGAVLEAYSKAVREQVQVKLLEPSGPAAERSAAEQMTEKGNPDGGVIGMEELKESIGQAKPFETQTREARIHEKERE